MTETSGNIRREPEVANLTLGGLAALVNSTLGRERLWAAHHYEPALPVTAAFSGESEEYVALVRTAATRCGPKIYDLLAEQKKDPHRCLGGEERRHIGRLVTGHLLAHPEAVEEIVPRSGARSREQIAGQLQAHVQGIAAIPRLFMYERYSRERAALAQKFFPPSGNSEAYLRGDELLEPDQLDDYWQSIQRLAYTQPLPDLLRLPIEQQQAIIQVLAEEYLMLCELVVSNNPDFLGKLPSPDTQAYCPLLTMTVEEVRRMIDEHQTVRTSQLFSVLWRYPQILPKKIAELETHSELARLRAFRAYAADYVALLANPRINKDVRRLSPDRVVLLSPPPTGLPTKSMAGILTDHLRLIAYEHFANSVEPSYAEAYAPLVQVPAVGARLKHDYANLHVVELPLDEERLAALELQYTDIDPPSFRRIGVGFQGKQNPDHITCTELLLYLKKHSGRPPTMKVVYETFPAALQSPKELQDLIDSSRGAAATRYRHAIARPDVQDLPPGITMR